MAEQQRQSLCPRLIDYLAIVGSRSPNIKCAGNSQSPPVQVISYKITNKYIAFLSKNIILESLFLSSTIQNGPKNISVMPFIFVL